MAHPRMCSEGLNCEGMGLIGVGAGTPPPEEYHLGLPSRTVYMKILAFMNTLDVQVLRPMQYFLLF